MMYKGNTSRYHQQWRFHTDLGGLVGDLERVGRGHLHLTRLLRLGQGEEGVPKAGLMIPVLATT